MMLADLRLALRSLQRSPGFTALAVSILALGLGASIALFSLVDALVLRVLPYPDPDRLVRLYRTSGQERSLPPAPASVRELGTRSALFAEVGGFTRREPLLEEPDQPPDLVWGLDVTASFFAVLQAKAQLGRLLTAEDEQFGREPVVVVSARLWRDRFGGDPRIIGRRLQLDGQLATVVGVMPPEFNDTPRYWGRTDVWRPLIFTPESLNDRLTPGLDVIARLQPGVTLTDANAALAVLASPPQPAPAPAGGLRAISLRDREGKDETGRVAWVTLGLAILLVAIACLNLTGVQTARMLERDHEHAIRSALGAGRRHLVRRALLESLLLSAVGGTLGLAVAHSSTELLGPRVLLDGARQVMGVRLAGPLEGRMLGLTVALVLLTTLVVGTVPAWLSARAGLAERLGRGGRSTSNRAHPRLRQSLVVLEMSLALVLLAAGGLFLRGLGRFADRDPGWRVDGLLTARITLPESRYPSREARAALLLRLQERLDVLGGVGRSAIAQAVPVSSLPNRTRFTVEGSPQPPGLAPSTYLTGISPGYFEALGIRLREGRPFRRSDGAAVIVNEALARQFWPGQNAVGKRLANATGAPAWRTVVGVVSDVRFPANLKQPETTYQAYFPLHHAPLAFTVALRASGALPPEALVASLRGAVAELDPALPVTEAMSARARVESYLSNFTLMGWILSGMAALGLLLAALAVYGLFSGFVAERRREIGVRMALGAQRSEVMRLMLAKGLRLALLGAGLGLAGAMMMARLLRSAMAELPTSDPAAVLVLAVALVAVALLACWVPARQAASLDPMVAMRSD
jgi:predicted permease